MYGVSTRSEKNSLARSNKTEGAKGLKFSRYFIVLFTLSFISGSLGSARMLLLPKLDPEFKRALKPAYDFPIRYQFGYVALNGARFFVADLIIVQLLFDLVRRKFRPPIIVVHADARAFGQNHILSIKSRPDRDSAVIWHPGGTNNSEKPLA